MLFLVAFIELIPWWAWSTLTQELQWLEWLTICSCSLIESSEHEDKSAGASGETPSQPYPAPVYSQPEEVKEEMDDAKPTKPEEHEESDALPDNWEMAYTEKGEVYFIEWVSHISLNISTKIIVVHKWCCQGRCGQSTEFH